MPSTGKVKNNKRKAKSRRKIVRNFYHFSLDLIFPKTCIGCGRAGKTLCADCKNQIKMVKTFCCPRCGRINRNGGYCPNCENQKKNFLTGVLVAADYERGPTKELIHHLKYAGIIEVAPILAGMLISRLAKSKLRGKKVLVPVPLHWFKKRSRGFNQAEILAKIVSYKAEIPLALALKRKKNTKSQVELTGRERRENLVGAFVCVDAAAVKDKTVILVDDVATTGTTLNECARVLRTAGARQVWGLVVARG